METDTSVARTLGRDWTPPAARRHWKEADGRAAIAALNASGESLKAFCRRQGLNDQRLRWWAARLEADLPPAKRGRRAGSPVAFLPVRVVSGAEHARPALVRKSSGDAIEVVVGIATVRIRPGFNGALLREVVGALAETRERRC